MKFILTTLMMAYLILPGMAEPEKAKEIAEQWRAFSGTEEQTASGLPDKIDFDFKKLDGTVLLFMQPTAAWCRYYPKDYYKTVNVEKVFYFLKNIGVTGIIYNGGFKSNGTMITKGKLPPLCFRYNKYIRGRDDLQEAAVACKKYDMGLWMGMHGLGEPKCKNPIILKAHKDLYARNLQGQVMSIYGNNNKGGAFDINSPKVFKYLSSQIDFFIDKLKPYGCLKGFFWDEFWFNIYQILLSVL